MNKKIKEADINRDYWGLKLDTKENFISYRLGNWRDPGWYWDGNSEDTLSFLYRIFNSEVWKEFLKEMKLYKITLDDFRPFIKESIENWDIYSLSGDNRLWYFHELADYTLEQASMLLTDVNYRELTEEEEELVENIIYYSELNYDSFLAWLKDNYPETQDYLYEALEKATDFEDFCNRLIDISDELINTVLDFINETLAETYNKILQGELK